MTTKPRLIPEKHALRTYAIERTHDDRVLEVFCTRKGARYYRDQQIKAGNWTRKGTRIVPGWWSRTAPSTAP